MIEIWKDIVGFEEYYQVSNFGRVKALEVTRKDSLGRKTTYKERILKGTNHKGYRRVTLNLNGYHHKLVHRLVADTFLPNPENKAQVNHKDFNTSNNKVENLEWNTELENVTHAVRGNRLNDRNCELNSNSKLTREQVIEIRKKYKNPVQKLADIGKKYNVTGRTIGMILRNETWKGVS